MDEIVEYLRYAVLPLGIFLITYFYATRNYGYWKKLGVTEVPPMFPLGSAGLDLNTTQGMSEQKWYKKYGKVFGIYEGSKPVLMVADPELLKDILVKDFNSFSHQRELTFGDPIMDRTLGLLNGEPWKNMRSIITPTFTSGKMRMMKQFINDCADTLNESFVEAAKRNKEIDVGRHLGAFTIDVIARCAFGIKLESRKDPDNPFVATARQAITPLPWRFVIGIFFPAIAKLIRLSIFNPKVTLYFKDVILKVIKSRSEMKPENKPKDFLQLMLDNQIDDAADDDAKTEKKKLELDDIVAQCVLFFIAGYFGTAATLTFVAHVLATHPEVQEKLIKEIDGVMKDKARPDEVKIINSRKHLRTDKEPDYDTIAEMKYLEAVVQEVLRLYSPAPRLERTSTEDYKLGDTGITIPKGMLVAVPVYALNHDPKYFPEPEKFNPDRFLPENKENIQSYTNLSFGAGPRNCVGMRFALMEVKLCLVKVLRQIRFKPGSKTKPEVELVKGKGPNRPKNVILRIVLREDR